MLKSRLYELELQKRKEEENKVNCEKKDIGWGNQIRSYILHPYKLIKDLGSLQNKFEALHGYELEAKIEKLRKRYDISEDHVKAIIDVLKDKASHEKDQNKS